MAHERNIVLLGFMGTGKSRVAGLLAGQLGWRQVDTDDEIERRAGLPIPEIFARHGEPWFRKLEHEVVRDLAAGQRLVIATGGGVVLNPENLRVLGASGVLVCLLADPEVIWERVRQETHRPLLAGGNPQQRIRDLLAKRRPLYTAIPLQVDTSHLTPESVAGRVLELWRMAERVEGRHG